MMQNLDPSSAMASATSARTTHQQPAAAAPPSIKNSILASLPPIVPSIGFSRGNKGDAATNSNDAALPEQSQSNSGVNQKSSPSNAASIPHSIKLGNRLILTSHTPRRWAWKSFHSSARHDSTQFYHWVRANVEYADYPYARFDVSLDPLSYTEEEYNSCLTMDGSVEELGTAYDLITGERKKEQEATTSETKKSPVEAKKSSTDNSQPSLHQLLLQSNKVLPWTKAETDVLMELTRACDLRWPVIIDRWRTRFQNSPISGLRRVEDLQQRYYGVGSILAQRRVEMVMAQEAANLAGVGGAVVAGQGGEAASSGGGATAAAGSAASKSFVADAAASSSSVNMGTDVSTNNNPTVGAIKGGDSKPLSPPSTQPPLQSTLPPDETEALRTAQQLTALHPSLAPPISLPGTGTAHRGAKMFDLAAERARRAHLERIWNRSKAEEREEEELRAELRAVEAQLRKLKKGGKHLAIAGSALAAPPPTASSPPPGTGDGAAGGAASAPAPGGFGARARPVNVVARGASSSSAAARHAPPKALASTLFSVRPPPDPFFYTRQDVSASFADTAPVPTPGTPYLQSGRLFPPSVEGHSGLNKSTLKQMGAILAELKVPKEPIPTKRSCDLYDGVRKEALTLLILQKMVLRKEAELTAKRGKLATMRGDAAKADAVAKAEERNVEEGKDAKEESAKGSGKNKKAKAVKAKRPRADSSMSAASNHAGAVAGEGAGKKGGDGPKKKQRKKSVATAAATPAVSAVASMAPSTTAHAPPSTPVTGLPGPVPSYNGIPPPASIPSIPNNAAISPIVAFSKKNSPRPQFTNSSPSLSSTTQPTAGTNVISSAVAPPLGTHPGKTVKRAGKKPRGRKKSSQ